MKRLLIISILVLAVFSLSAYSILDMNSGNQVFRGDARLLSMGNAGVYNQGESVSPALNPGLAGLLPNGLRIQFNTGTIINSEDRSIPMYNFFDGYIDDANYVSNSNAFGNITGNISYKTQLDDMGVGMYLGYNPVVDFNSDYEEQVRNDGNTDSGNSGDNSPNGYPPVIARNYLESAGDLGGINVGAGVSWNEQISAGIQFQQLAGDWDYNRRIMWTDAAEALSDDDLPNSDIEVSGEFDDAWRLGWGLAYEINERLGVGFAMQMKSELDREVNGSIDGIAAEEIFMDTITVNGELDSLYWQDELEANFSDYILPGSYRIGFRYHPRNVWATYMNFDVEYVNYSDIDERFSDVTNYYIGLEHQVNKKLPMRFGFNYKTSYHIFVDGDSDFARKVTMPSFTAGTGFKVMNAIDVDLGIEYSLRKYDQLDLFMDGYYNQDGLWNEQVPMDRDWNNPDQVDESLITLQASFTWHWQVK
jgi:long-subunit fatty acid transport protein